MKIQVVFIFIIAMIFACGGGKETGKKGSSDEALVAGKKAYTYCVACHGTDGKQGINGAKDFAESVLSVQERVEIITHGQGMMTPFKGILKPEEIEAVAKYTVHLGNQGKE